MIDYFELAKAMALRAADGYKMRFPIELKEEVGLNEKEINSFKGKGCQFYGRKTCSAWVFEYLNKITATESENAPLSRHQRKAASKLSGSVSKNDSPASSPETR